MIMEYTFTVEHKVIRRTVIKVESDRYEQAESDMLKKALDKGLDVADFWLSDHQAK